MTIAERGSGRLKSKSRCIQPPYSPAHGESHRLSGSGREKKMKIANSSQLMVVGQAASDVLATAQGSGTEVGSKCGGGSGMDMGNSDATSLVMGVSNSAECRSAGSPVAVFPPSAASSRPAVSHGCSSTERSEKPTTLNWKPAEGGKVQERKIIRAKRPGGAERGRAGEVRQHGHTIVGALPRKSKLSWPLTRRYLTREVVLCIRHAMKDQNDRYFDVVPDLSRNKGNCVTRSSDAIRNMKKSLAS